MLELEADGTLLERPPTGGSTGARNTGPLFQLEAWAGRSGGWIVFGSSTGFQLPDGSVRSPDTSVVRLGWVLLPQGRDMEVWKPEASTAEPRFTELRHAPHPQRCAPLNPAHSSCSSREG